MSSGRRRTNLEGRVAAIDVIEPRAGTVPADSSRALRVLPSTNVVLGLQLRGRIRHEAGLLEPMGVTGIQSGARRYEYVGAMSSVLVRFTAQGACCLGVPVSELSDRSVGLADLLPAARVRALRQRLADLDSAADAVAVVEAMLGELAWTPDLLIDRAVELLGAGVTVAAVARTLEISERQLERRFLVRVGLTPKRFASLRRFERALALAAGASSLTEVALEAGYCDQSHFIREVRRFTDTTPSELLASVPA